MTRGTQGGAPLLRFRDERGSRDRVNLNYMRDAAVDAPRRPNNAGRPPSLRVRGGACKVALRFDNAEVFIGRWWF